MAHAVHPNYADKHEPGHKPRFGDGVVIKHNANQRYATDAVTAWLFRELGERAGVPVQVSVFIFTNRVITYSRGTAMGDWTDAFVFNSYHRSLSFAPTSGAAAPSGLFCPPGPGYGRWTWGRRSCRCTASARCPRAR